MKLVFNKEENNEITVKIQNGTILEEFSYIKMVKQLIEDNSLDDIDYGNLDEDEKSNMENMLKEIAEIFDEEKDTDETKLDEPESQIADETKESEDDETDLPF